MSIEEKFRQEYIPLMNQFMKEIEGVNAECLPEPLLPVYGKDYENVLYKIAFVGWEGRNGKRLNEFMSEYKNSGAEKVIHWWDEDFDEDDGFGFADYYHNHTGNDFWGFIFKFLSCFYDKPDWREIKEKKYPELLKSFIWSNISSIERFEITDRGKNDIKEWEKVKKASLIFDNAMHLINVFNPKIIIVLRWQKDDTWLTGNFECSHTKFADHLDYYFINRTNTHIFWTAHPGWLFRNKRINETIEAILQKIVEKQVFKSFPGERFLIIKQKRRQLLKKLKQQLEKEGREIGLSPNDEDWGLGGESYFRFDIPDSKRNCAIYFGFYIGYKDFSIGVYIKDQSEGYLNLKHEISAKLTPVIGISRNHPKWAYLRYFDDDLKNWETNSKVWANIENGSMANILFEKVQKIRKSLEGMEL